MGWILNIIALQLFSLISLVDTIVRLVTKRSGKSAFTKAFNINVFGNYLFGKTLNICLLKKDVSIFGRFGEPISSVLGKAYIREKLNWFGHIIRFLVDAADVPMWIKGKSHCVEWIRSEEDIKETALKISK